MCSFFHFFPEFKQFLRSNSKRYSSHAKVERTLTDYFPYSILSIIPLAIFVVLPVKFLSIELTGGFKRDFDKTKITPKN